MEDVIDKADATQDEIAEHKARMAEERMVTDGTAVEESGQVDYFAFDKTATVYLPDGRSWVEIKVLNEGARRKYMNAVQRDVRIQKATGDLVTKVSAGEERVALLQAAIVNWNLISGGKPLVFNDSNLRKFLDVADPKVIDHIEKEVRKANPWLLNEVSVEDIDEQIKELTELREAKVKEEAGNAPSSSS